MNPSGHGFRRRPIVAADFHPLRNRCEGSLLLVPPASDRTRGPPLTRRLLFLLSYGGGDEKSTSAVSTRERPVGRGVSLHAAWPGVAHIPAANTLSRGSECMGTPEVERMTSLELVASTMAWSRSAI